MPSSSRPTRRRESNCTWAKAAPPIPCWEPAPSRCGPIRSVHGRRQSGARLRVGRHVCERRIFRDPRPQAEFRLQPEIGRSHLYRSDLRPAQGAPARDGARLGVGRRAQLCAGEGPDDQRQLYDADRGRRTARLAGQRRAGLRGGGAHTEGTTLGATAALADGWTVSGSGTLARTNAPQSALSSLSLPQAGLQSTAYELAATKLGVLSELDSLRVSLTQPLHVESGALFYTLASGRRPASRYARPGDRDLEHRRQARIPDGNDL